MNFRKINSIVAWGIFAITMIVYGMTVAPTVSYWDCGEFIAASYKLAVPHPPGAPLYLLVGRLFSMLPFAENIALRVNYISVLSSAFTVMLLYLIIVHLVREWKGKLEESHDWLTAIYSGALGALTFAFTHSFWFNAVEAEVYAASMLFTALIVWLSMVWSEKHDQPGNERYLLMMAYVIGLAIGVHLLNVLALPYVALMVLYKKFEFNFKNLALTSVITIGMILLVYPGIVKYLPVIALNWGVAGMVIVLVALIWAALWAMNNHKYMAGLISMSILLVVIGYSTYATIYIRSNLNPNIDENNPETVENFVKYLNREQYGDHSITDRAKVMRESPNGKRYSSVNDFFWDYQINKMYVRYFLWQFVGMAENEVDWSAKQFFAVPFLLGLLGIFWQFKNDSKNGLAVLALFFMTGLAIILYLNQPDPQPRERDYSYVGSFFAFSIWIGLGFAGVMELIRGPKKEGKPGWVFPTAVFAILILLAPVQMLAKNYKTHDRSSRYIAWDYSYNMLNSCEEGGILFTNGDNDTFPLWYLQEVEGIRTDVRIVNLSLLNTDWYIKQLRDLDPKVPIALHDAQIDQLGLVPWKPQKITLEVPENVGSASTAEFRNRFSFLNIDNPDAITFEVKPAINTSFGGVLRVQDYMILNILHANKWRKPVYFAVTVARSNMLNELQEYLRMDGLTLKLVPFKNWQISPDHLERNLVDVYKYRGLQTPGLYFDGNVMGLLQNYRTAFLQLTQYYARQNDMDKVKSLLAEMDERVPGDVIPWTNRYLRLLFDSYSILSDPGAIDSMLAGGSTRQDLQLIGENLYQLNKLAPAGKIFERLYQDDPDDVQTLSILINIYERDKDYTKGAEILEKWLERVPNDINARKKLEQFKKNI
jgi:hypothetical protein